MQDPARGLTVDGSCPARDTEGEDPVTDDTDPGAPPAKGKDADGSATTGHQTGPVAHWFEAEHDGIDESAWQIDPEGIWEPPAPPHETSGGPPDAGEGPGAVAPSER